eukprot:Blabericola_migrator_1__8407@NODE_437_length_8486_cov_74_294215_g343_i0_p1_GENE_NODE_437_length_8486_cov_74_294215_g343_i0NODE_437_length_8486_cov_74_294215_g343_i0_p1_ORF_typecomplete_len1225_score220_95ABC_tran/PF00005_27/4_4e29ABC_tran/PF00005_27/1_4e02ABC_tran/PF00005_27/1_5e06ABC_membrane/PF00664_23/1_9e14ABC_membrane/PF00664_23/1_8e18_NODE_437_length_8486_cov_74_294215_g343_i045718245
MYQCLFQSIGNLIVSLVFEWKMALVMLIGVIAVGGEISAYLSGSHGSLRRVDQSSAETTIEEAINSIRTVSAYGLESLFSRIFTSDIDQAVQKQLDKIQFFYILRSGFLLIIFAAAGFGCWVGASGVSHQAVNDPPSTSLDQVSQVITVTICMCMACFALFSFTPSYHKVSCAIKATKEMKQLINRVSRLDPFDEEGVVPARFRGAVEFHNVGFSHQTSPGSKGQRVMHNLSFSIAPGEIVAIVGEVNSGRSKTLKLLQRLYDPDDGQIMVDGRDIRCYHLQTYRDLVGYVDQDPGLFFESVARNIEMGSTSYPVSRHDVKVAAKRVGVHQSVKALPFGYDTIVGPVGLQNITEGLRRRIALARMMLKDPSILLIDEATSSLDSEAEAYVQFALDKLISCRRRTTIIIPSNLTILERVDRVLVFANPDGRGIRCVDSGTHQGLLMKPHSPYRMILSQQGILISMPTKLRSPAVMQPMDLSSVELSSYSKTERPEGPPRDSRTFQVPELIWQTENTSRSFSVRIAARELTASRSFYCAVLATVYIGAMPSILALMMEPLVISMYSFMTGASHDTGVIANPITQALRSTAPFYVCAALLCVGLSFVASYGMYQSRCRVTTSLQKQTFQHILHQDMEYLDTPSHSLTYLKQLVFDDCQTVGVLLTCCLPTLLKHVAAAVIVLIVTLHAHMRVGVITLVALSARLPTDLARCYIKRKMIDRQQMKDPVLEEYVEQRLLISSFNLEEPMLATYCDYLTNRPNGGHILLAATALTSGFVATLNPMCCALAFWYGGSTALQGNENSFAVRSILRIVLLLILNGYGTANCFSWLDYWLRMRYAICRLAVLLKRESLADTRNTADDVSTLSVSEIVFSNVTFRYTHIPQLPVLSGLSLQVKKGDRIALIGNDFHRNALYDLLESFYDMRVPSPALRFWFDLMRIADTAFDTQLSYSDLVGGSILINGIDLTRLSPLVLRRALGYVPHTPYIYKDWTLLENITLSRLPPMVSNSTDQSSQPSTTHSAYSVTHSVSTDKVVIDILHIDITSLIELCALQALIDRCRLGLHTKAMDAQLTPSEVVRLGLARALYRQPSVLLIGNVLESLPLTDPCWCVMNDILQSFTVLLMWPKGVDLDTLQVDKCVLIGPHTRGGGSVLMSGTANDVVHGLESHLELSRVRAGRVSSYAKQLLSNTSDTQPPRLNITRSLKQPDSSLILQSSRSLCDNLVPAPDP